MIVVSTLHSKKAVNGDENHSIKAGSAIGVITFGELDGSETLGANPSIHGVRWSLGLLAGRRQNVQQERNP